MNSLSWMIYGAEVAGNLQTIAVGVALIVGLFGGTAICVFGFDSQYKYVRKWIPAYILIMSVSGLIAVFTPSSDTIYMIAASEAGEAVVTSPEGKEMLGDLKEIIRRKLAKELKGEVAL